MDYELELEDFVGFAVAILGIFFMYFVLSVF